MPGTRSEIRHSHQWRAIKSTLICTLPCSLLSLFFHSVSLSAFFLFLLFFAVEYAFEHPDCVNGIFDIRYPSAVVGGSGGVAANGLRIRIFDVPKSTLLAKPDNLVGEIRVSMQELIDTNSNKQTITLLPTNPKPELAQRMRDANTSVTLSARMRANLLERRAAGLGLPQRQQLQQQQHAPSDGSGLSAPPVGAAMAVGASAPVPAVSSAVSPSPSVFGVGVSSVCQDAIAFSLVRSQLRSYGVERFQNEMVAAGWFVRGGGGGGDGGAADLLVNTADKPFNPFARIVAGKLPAPYGNLLRQHGLLDADERFFVAQNRAELVAQWASADPAWLGKASMAERHEFLLLRSLHWSTFNVLTFAINGDAIALQSAIRLLGDMRATARSYSAAAGWSSNLGLFFHCHPLNSVQALHLHMLDLDHTGPTFEHLNHKNLPLAEVIKALWEELRRADPDRAEEVREIISDEHTTRPADTATSISAAPMPVAAGPSSRALAFARAQKAAAAADDDDHEKGESDVSVALRCVELR